MFHCYLDFYHAISIADNLTYLGTRANLSRGTYLLSTETGNGTNFVVSNGITIGLGYWNQRTSYSRDFCTSL